MFFFEPKGLYRAAVEDVPEGEYVLPLGSAEIVEPGMWVCLLLIPYSAGNYEYSSGPSNNLLAKTKPHYILVCIERNKSVPPPPPPPVNLKL